MSNDTIRSKQSFINAASLGSNEVIAAFPNQRIRVLSVAAVSASANTIKFLSNTTDISASMSLAANGGIVLPFHRLGWFTTALGEGLQINLTVSAAVGVTLTYEVIQ